MTPAATQVGWTTLAVNRTNSCCETLVKYMPVRHSHTMFNLLTPHYQGEFSLVDSPLWWVLLQCSLYLSFYLSIYLSTYLSICLSILNHVLVVHACVYIYMYIKIDCICWHAVADIIVSPSVWSSKNPWTQRRGKCGVVGTRFQLPGVSLDLDELEGPDTKTNEAFLAWRWNQ